MKRDVEEVKKKHSNINFFSIFISNNVIASQIVVIIT